MKRQLAIEVKELINGAVLLQVEDELAWSAFIDGQDCETIGTGFFFLILKLTGHDLICCSEGYDFDILRQYQKLFPNQALARLIRTYLAYLGAPLSDDDEEEKEAPAPSASLDDMFSAISVRIVQCISHVHLLTSQIRKPNRPYNRQCSPGG